MKRSFISLSLLLGMALIFAYGCKKDDQDDKVTDHSTLITSIDAKILRIADNEAGGINIFMSVTDQNGNAIGNLDESNFEIFEVKDNGVAVPLSQSGGSSQPSMILTALTLDYSGSMYYDTASIPSMENAIASFITMKSPLDQVELIKFSQNVDVTVPLTSNDMTLLSGLTANYPNSHGSTALYRSIMTGQQDVMNATYTNPYHLPSVIAFTDGKNNEDPMSMDSLLLFSFLNQVPVYTVGYGVQPDTNALSIIADSTGGDFFWSPNVGMLNNLYQMVSGQLSSTTIVTVTTPGTKGKKLYRVKANVTTSYGYFEDTDERYFYF